MAEREWISFDQGWKFHYGDIVSIRNRWAWEKSGSWNQGPESRSFYDGDWRDVELPHDFVIETKPTPYMADEFGADNVIPAMEDVNNIHTTAGSFQKDVGWYRKHFFIPKSEEGKKLYLIFDGIYRDSAAYLNEFFIGNERSGYKRIEYEITDFVNYGGDNLLVIRADAREAEGWFYEGGGIYRHAYLLKTSRERIVRTYVRSQVDLRTYSADVTVEVEGEDWEGGNLVVVLFAPDGTEVARQEARVEGEKHTVRFCRSNGRQLEQVKLWDMETPYLYQAAVHLFVDGEEKDCEITRFGVRAIAFDCEKGFLLNGKPVKIKGACCHQQHGGLGTAVPDEVYRYRIRRLKEMGCNAYRSSHYPMAESLLAICDEMGMLVMDENRLLSSEAGDLKQLETMVLRDRNHPSVILYSIGNEEAQSQTTPQGARIAGTMIRHIKKLDPDTPVTMALVMWDLKHRIPIEDVHQIAGIGRQLDVAGFNYNWDKWLPYRETFPGQPMICTEQGTFKSTRGCYETDAARCHLAITDGTADSYMKGAEQWHVCRPGWMSGLFIWTGFDYYGEPTPYAWPAISSQFGAMDLCGYPKDFYYYYKAWWSDDPVLHLFPHWNGRTGEKKDLYVFSNWEEVELSVNGRSFGRKPMEQDGYLVWKDIPFEPGVVCAVGYRDGKKQMETCICTVQEAVRIRLAVDEALNEIKIIRAEIVDEAGQIVPEGDWQIQFETDHGRILGTSNGDPSDHTAPTGSVRRAFHGLAQVIVKAEGSVTITARAEKIAAGEITVG